MSEILINNMNLQEIIINILKSKEFTICSNNILANNNIEIIAKDERLITKGKYLFYISNSSKELELYVIKGILGTLVSEKINKGIVVSAAPLSSEAIEFANRNNIEIIDNEKINLLINEYNHLANNMEVEEVIEKEIIEDIEEEIDEPIYFIDIDGFDKKRYIDIQNEVEKFGLYSQQKQIKDLFQYYITNNKYEINKHGLIDEYINFNNKVIKMYDIDRSLVVNREDNKLFNRYLYLLKGDIVNSLGVLSDFGFRGAPLDIGIFTDWNQYIIRNSRNEIFFCPNVSMLLKNYLVIFNYVGFNKGKDAIISIFDEYIQKIKKGRGIFSSKLGKKSYDEYFEEDEAKYRELLKDIEDNIERNIHCPIGIRINKRDDSYEMEFSKDSIISVDDLFEQYDLNKEDIKEKLVSNKERVISIIKDL